MEQNTEASGVEDPELCWISQRSAARHLSQGAPRTRPARGQHQRQEPGSLLMA